MKNTVWIVIWGSGITSILVFILNFAYLLESGLRDM